MFTDLRLVLAILVVGCNDNGLQVVPDDPEPTPGELTPEPTPPPDDDSAEPTPPPPEECNGVDDDGDGLVDEDFPDSDSDGLADCVDSTCTLDNPIPGEVTVQAGCWEEGDDDDATPQVVTDPWNLAIEWQWTGTVAGSDQVIVMPAVGNLTDDNGDGQIDETDVPDIVVVAYGNWNTANAELVALDGASGTELWTATGFDGYGGPSIADVDADGTPDVIAFSGTEVPLVDSNNGTFKWSAVSGYSVYAPQSTVADLDGDGIPEVIADRQILRGTDGLQVGILPDPGVPYRVPSVGDIDQDGEQEVILGPVVWSLSQGVEWTAPISGSFGHWTAIADVDGDPEGEVIMVAGDYGSNGQFKVYDPDGVELYGSTFSNGSPGPQAVADFDGDGVAEVAFASQGMLYVRELNGTPLWGVPVSDVSGLAGVSGYDVDGDQRYEVLYADEHTVYILDGLTGTTLWSMGGHSSGTLWEYPVVADVDADGSAEIVIASNDLSYGGWTGVTVIGHVNDGWLPSGPTWPVHDFAVTNVLSDGTVPQVPQPNWQLFNTYRARPQIDTPRTELFDLTVAITDVCWPGCATGDRVGIVAQVSNVGPLDVDHDIVVALFALSLDSPPVETPLDVRLTPPLASGRSSAGVVFDIDATQVGPGGLRVRVDNDGFGQGTVVECDEDDNVATWTDIPCGH